MTDAVATRRLVFDRTADAPAAAREWVASGGGLPRGRRDDAILLVSEIVSNAVRHGAGDVIVETELSDSLVRVVVVDGGGGSPNPLVGDPAPEREFGRGLQLVDRLSDRWGFTVGATTRVWFEMWLRDDVEDVVLYGPGAVLEAVAAIVEQGYTAGLVETLVETLAAGMGFTAVRFVATTPDAEIGPVHAVIRHAGQAGLPPRPDEADIADAIREIDQHQAARIHSAGPGRAALLLVPVRAAGAPLGVLACVGSEGVPFDEVDRAIVSAAAAQLAQVMEKQRVEAAQQTLVGALAFLAEASRLLASSLDYEETLQQIARLVVPSRADWCTVNLIEPGGSIRRVAAEHADPAARPSLIELLDRHPHDPDATSGVPLVIRTGSSLLYEEVPEQLLADTAHNEEYLEITRKLQIRSCVIVPIEAQGRTLGTMSVVSADPERLRYGTADLAVFEDLGRRAGVAIENARLYTDHVSIARALQRALLPDVLPDVPGFDIAARYAPAAAATEVGGDFYDVIGAGDASWHIFVGDVQGKGPEAATLLGLARHTVRSASLRGDEPAQSLLALNTALLASPTDRLATAVLAELRTSDGVHHMRLARAGHPPPLLVRRDGTVEVLEPLGMLLGAYESVRLDEQSAELAPGDRLVLYTDGAFGDSLDEERLIDVVSRSGPGSADDLARLVLDASERAGPRIDDFTVVVVGALG